MYIISRVNEEQEKLNRPLSQAERFRLIDEIICKITPENKVNLLLFDGEILYVHTNYRDSLYQCQKGAAVVVSTRPLTKEIWEPEPMNRLAAYHNGNLFCTGTDHKNEFFDSEEKTRLQFLDFAGL